MAAIWVAPRSFSSHEDEGSFCLPGNDMESGRETGIQKGRET